MEDKNIKKLREEVFEANIELSKSNLVLFTFGNVSGADRERQLIAIKPSGVDYEKLTPEDIVIISFNGEQIYGQLKPSVDTKVHLKIYEEFTNIGGITHTHSRYATSFAQACIPIDCLGTSHADYFLGQVPCTDYMSDESLSKDYEEETGKLILDTFRKGNVDENNIKACLVAGHGPFVWGESAMDSVKMSIILEEIAWKNYITMTLNKSIKPLKKTLLEKHFYRQHGKNAYYGQR